MFAALLNKNLRTVAGYVIPGLEKMEAETIFKFLEN